MRCINLIGIWLQAVYIIVMVFGLRLDYDFVKEFGGELYIGFTVLFVVLMCKFGVDKV